MVNLLKMAFIIALFIVSKIIISKVTAKRIRKAIFEEIEINNKSKYIKYLEDANLIKAIIVFFGILLIAIINGHNIFFAIVIGILFTSLLSGFYVIKSGLVKKQVLQDLLNVSECLRVQISSQISLENALRSLPELCENKEFSLLLTNVYLEYELSKFIILDSKEALIKKFNYPEMRIFISALNQQTQGTSAIEALDNLISLLREKYIEFLEDSTKSKMAIMTAGVFIIVINIATLGIYPIAVEAFDAINVMLK